MSNADWLGWVQGVGFPAAVAGFVLWRVERRLAAIETAVVRLVERVGSNEDSGYRDWGGAIPSPVAEEGSRKHRARAATER